MRKIKTSVKENNEQKNETMSIRPSSLDEYIGQEALKKQLVIMSESAKIRNTSMGHMLFYGPPGLGKTSLALIAANLMDSKLHYISGPTIEKPGDIASALARLEPNDVLFCDEIHRIPKNCEEMLYSALEDNFYSITIGVGEQQKHIKMTLPPFTFIGATTRYGMISGPLRDRFQLVEKLDYYSLDELSQIIVQTCNKLSLSITYDTASIIAASSRGTPRIANKHTKLVGDYAIAKNDSVITKEIIEKSFALSGINSMGLTRMDQQILCYLSQCEKPVGLKALAFALGEDVQTVEEVYEPYLLMKHYITRTPKGRMISPQGKSLLSSCDFDTLRSVI